MGEFENAIADGVVAEMGAGEAPVAPTGGADVHGGPGTVATLNYDRNAGPGGAVVGMHEAGAATRPLEGFHGAPADDDEGPDTMEAREAAYAKAVKEKRLSEAASQESLRRFRSDPVITHERVEGLEHLLKRTER